MIILLSSTCSGRERRPRSARIRAYGETVPGIVQRVVFFFIHFLYVDVATARVFTIMSYNDRTTWVSRLDGPTVFSGLIVREVSIDEGWTPQCFELYDF